MGAGAAAIATAGAAVYAIALDTRSPVSLFRLKRAGKLASWDETVANLDPASRRWFEDTKQPIRMAGPAGTRLHAWKFDPDTATPLPHRYAICVHGYTGEPLEMAPWAYHYARLGFTVLVPAQRGHELSGGRYVGLGYEEAKDVLAWTDAVVAADSEAEILLDGNSMGAATVLAAAGSPEAPENIRGVVADSAYCDAYGQLVRSTAQTLHVPRRLATWIVDAADIVNRLVLKRPFTAGAAITAIGGIKAPVLLVQGSADDVVDPQALSTLYLRASETGRHVQKLQIAGAAHTASVRRDPALYWSTVDGFLRRCGLIE